MMGVEAGAFGQQRVRALTDRHFSFDRIGLPLLVERHHDHAGAEALDDGGLGEEVGLAFLQADRVDDGLALDALEAREDHRPLRAVDHERHPRDVRLGPDVVQEPGHHLLGVEHALVHVDVDEIRTAAHLLERDLRRRRVVARLDQARELQRAGDVGSFADHLEVRLRPNRERFEPCELGVRILNS